MGSVVISGATSGAVTLAVPDEAGTRTLTLPATTGTILTNDISQAGDTSAGDDAAVGYTAGEGLILTGQGSTNDVTIKNDADADVLVIPTGTTNVDIVGVATAATFEPDGDTSAGDNAAIGYTSAEGLILTGQGSTSDVTIKNDADATVLCIPTGTINVGIGSVNALDNLHVFDTTNSAIATQLLLQNQGAGNHTAGIAFQVSSSGEVASTTYAPKAGILFERTTANGRGPIKFMVDNAADNNGFSAGDEVMRIHVDGKIGIGTTAPTRTLTVIGSVGNQFVGSQSQSNDTAKYGTYAGSHYHNAEQDVTGIVVLSNGTDNIVYLGGGVGEQNAATVLAFHTGANDATTGGTERMRVDSAGKVGIGTNSPASYTSDTLVISSGDQGGMTLVSADNVENYISWADGTSGAAQLQAGYIGYNHSSNYMRFGTVATERMRIESNGNVLVGTTAAYSDGSIGNGIFQLDGRHGARIGMTCRAKTSDGSAFVTSGTGLIGFVNGNGHVGNISVDGTATSFNTSSDYRLKENIDYSWDATTRLKQLKPARFNFIADADKTVDGFIAHEVSSIVPEAITGEKDAATTTSNNVLLANGMIVETGVTQSAWTQGKADGAYPSDSTWEASSTKPVYQNIDQSKLVPLLVKTIQELEARITALEAG